MGASAIEQVRKYRGVQEIDIGVLVEVGVGASGGHGAAVAGEALREEARIVKVHVAAADQFAGQAGLNDFEQDVFVRADLL